MHLKSYLLFGLCFCRTFWVNTVLEFTFNVSIVRFFIFLIREGTIFVFALTRFGFVILFLLIKNLVFFLLGLSIFRFGLPQPWDKGAFWRDRWDLRRAGAKCTDIKGCRTVQFLGFVWFCIFLRALVERDSLDCGKGLWARDPDSPNELVVMETGRGTYNVDHHNYLNWIFMLYLTSKGL